MELSEDKIKKLEEAFRSVNALSIAETKNNQSSCASFHIEPFHTKWDEETVKEVMYHVQLYVKTWIRTPLAEILDVDVSEYNKEIELSYCKERIRILEKQLSEKRSSTDD